MTRESHHRFGAAAAVVVLVLGASGCGSSGGSSGDTNSKGSSGATPTKRAEATTVTVKKGPFCDAFDAGTVTTTLHAKAPLSLTRQLKPGQKFRFFPGGPTSTARFWECDYNQKKFSKPYVTFSALVSAGVPYTKKLYDLELKSREDSVKRDKKATCESSPDDDTLGSGGRLLVCSRPEEKSGSSFSSGYATVSYYALAKDTKLVCGVSSSDDKDVDTIKSAAASLCADFHDAVTE